MTPTDPNAYARAARDPVELRSALRTAQTGPMLMVHAQLTGETDLLARSAPHIAGAWPHMQLLPEALQHELVERLAGAIEAMAARGADARPALSGRALQGVMSAGVGAHVPHEYLDLMIEETGIGEDDPRMLRWSRPPPAAALRDFPVLVIGAGFSGIVAGIRLKQAGVPFVIVEKNPTTAGTWYENTYPGCGVDTVSHFYSFSFRPNHDWTHYFAKRDEIYAYIEAVVDEHGLREHIRFGEEVEQLRWNEARALWEVDAKPVAGGASVRLEARAVISAVGLLNRPSTPDIPGLDVFGGPVLHTAAWDDGVDLAGRRVAVVGTGASGMQVGPALAPVVEHLTVFQRSAHWVNHNPLYHSQVSPGQRWALQHIPHFSQWQRFLFFWGSSDGLHSSLKMDPDWPHPEQSLNAANHQIRQTLIDYLKRQLAGRDDLIAKCLPDYPPYGKRMLRDNHWFEMLKRPNVTLETTGIARANERAVVLEDGRSVEVDAIVFATGFHAGRMLWPMRVIGRGGVHVRDVWGDEDARAYKGITVPGFPNLFLTSGPNTGLAHGGSHFFHSECQVKYITEAIRQMVENDWKAVEVRADAHDRYNEAVDRRASGMVWAHPGVKSWYKNSKGRVTIISPWRLVEYWNQTRAFDAEAYRITSGLPCTGKAWASGALSG